MRIWESSFTDVIQSLGNSAIREQRTRGRRKERKGPREERRRARYVAASIPSTAVSSCSARMGLMKEGQWLLPWGGPGEGSAAAGRTGDQLEGRVQGQTGSP